VTADAARMVDDLSPLHALRGVFLLIEHLCVNRREYTMENRRSCGLFTENQRLAGIRRPICVGKKVDLTFGEPL
jgi:hypothetical protein